MELNKAACEAATGAFIERLTDKPATSDLLAALRFALEAYESVRLAAAPASQQEADVSIAVETWQQRMLKDHPELANNLEGQIAWEVGHPYKDEEIGDLRAELARFCRAQRTTEGK